VQRYALRGDGVIAITFDSGWGDSGWGDSGWGDPGWGDSGWGDPGWGDPGWGTSPRSASATFSASRSRR